MGGMSGWSRWRRRIWRGWLAGGWTRSCGGGFPCRCGPRTRWARTVSLPFALIEKGTGRAIGSTRYGNIDRTHHRVEIGWTWVAREWQRSAVNTEAKYLLLRHAFETLGCIRVELKTDSLNEKSRAAILRIGAKEEGIFRNHMITSSGRIRHTVYFSIVDSEWPAVKARLFSLLNSRKA